MAIYTSPKEDDLEIFLSFVGRHLGKTGAAATIDLYIDQEIESEEARSLFEELKHRQVRGGDRSKKREDPLMGIALDLETEEGVRRFSLLGFRTIGCEAFAGNKLVFTSLENEQTVWLDFPESILSDLESNARKAGANRLMRC